MIPRANKSQKAVRNRNVYGEYEIRPYVGANATGNTMVLDNFIWIWEIATLVAFIVLTIAAWIRGWGWKACLPFGLTALASGMGGMLQELLELPRLTPLHALAIFLPWDLIVMGVLAWMVAFPPASEGTGSR
jgi:hypothetical protein